MMWNEHGLGNADYVWWLRIMWRLHSRTMRGLCDSSVDWTRRFHVFVMRKDLIMATFSKHNSRREFRKLYQVELLSVFMFPRCNARTIQRNTDKKCWFFQMQIQLCCFVVEAEVTFLNMCMQCVWHGQLTITQRNVWPLYGLSSLGSAVVPCK